MVNDKQLIPVILSGGSGTRLWPLSRQARPKQFLKLVDDCSLLQSTLNRLQALDIQVTYLVCNQEHRFLVAEQMRQLAQTAEIILEPIAKNTAPAITLAAMQACHTLGDAFLLVLPADHLIQEVKAFHLAIKQAMVQAELGYLVTFGVQPTSPETGYGYIKRGQPLTQNAYRVGEFVEKPDLETAKYYLKSGHYYWNSGMFLFRASAYLAELKRLCPDIYSACERAMQGVKEDLDFIRIDQEAFSRSPADSIDYAVMEKTDKAVMVPLDAGWMDIGSWQALWDVSAKDQQGNVLKGDVLAEQTNDSFIFSSNRLVTTLGVRDLVVIETKDAVLVADKANIQQVKVIVEQLTKMARPEVIQHSEVYRPWGSFDCVDQGGRYQVKRIVVKPGARLSVQMHHHRAEHWVVVKGTAKVTNGDKTYFLTENESTFIPIGRVHSLENPGKIPLELIEVQSGTYLGEDDIIRFEDVYGR